MQREIEDTVLEHFSDDNVTHIKRLVYFFASTKAKQEANADYLRLKSEPTSRLAAVLVLLFEENGQIRVLLTTRAKDLRTHGGQTALPGGKAEATDADILQTAFREANEEVSLPLDSPFVHLLGTLDLHPFHKLIVTPVVALLTDNSILKKLKARDGEVEHIFSYPLKAILEPDLAPVLERELVEPGSVHWPYEKNHHHFKDYEVPALGGTSYRWHYFRSSASPVTGLTADILMQTAEIVYEMETKFERYAPNQLRTYEDMVEAYKRNQTRRLEASLLEG